MVNLGIDRWGRCKEMNPEDEPPRTSSDREVVVILALLGGAYVLKLMTNHEVSFPEAVLSLLIAMAILVGCGIGYYLVSLIVSQFK